jgi:hypothetical protein
VNTPSLFSPVRIGPVEKAHTPLGPGCWPSGPDRSSGKEDANLLAAMDAALRHHAFRHNRRLQQRLFGAACGAVPGVQQDVGAAPEFLARRTQEALGT